MDIPRLLRFAPAPVRTRRDGWTPERQRRFVLNLARGMGVAEAVQRVGCSRQTVYALRDKPGAESFAAAWDAAIAFATHVRCAPRPIAQGGAGIETVLIPRHYRGRLVGFVQREDVSGAMRILAQLDRLAHRMDSRDACGADPAKTDKAGMIARANA